MKRHGGRGRIARWLFGDEYGDLVLYRSRHYAQLIGQPPEQALLGRQTVDLVRTEVVLFALSQADRGNSRVSVERGERIWLRSLS
jgi:hypothetical protein